jgi:hypothetical protein
MIRFAPKATEMPHSSEMTRSANSDRTQRSKIGDLVGDREQRLSRDATSRFRRHATERVALSTNGPSFAPHIAPIGRATCVDRSEAQFAIARRDYLRRPGGIEA